MDKEYDLYLVLGSLLISFLASFLAIAFAGFTVWQKKNSSQMWLFAAALNMGLGIWAMHFIGMLALHLETETAFEINRTIASALIPVAASYLTFSLLLSIDFQSKNQRLFYAALVFGSGITSMHYLGMDAMQMVPAISYDPVLFSLSLIIAFVASFFGLNLFFRAVNQPEYPLFSKPNLMIAVVTALAVTGMHYTGMAAAIFEPNAYCSVLSDGIRRENLSTIIIGAILMLLLLSFILLAYEQSLVVEAHAKQHEMLDRTSTEVVKRTTELEQQILMNERLLETMDAIVVVLDHNGVIQQFNLAAQQATGYRPDEVKGHYVWEMLVPNEVEDEVKAVFSRLTSGMFPNQHLNDWLRRDGTHISIDWHNSALVDESGKVTHVIATGIDVTQVLRDQEELKLSAVAFETQEAMVVTDSRGSVLRVNQAFESITGYSQQEAIGRNMNMLKSGRHERYFYQSIWSEIAKKGFWQGEIWNKRKNGEVYPEWLRITRVQDDAGRVINYIGNFSDISQRKKIENELERLAFYDEVTLLPNRRLLTDRLIQAVRLAKRHKHTLGIMFIDLDNFKQINDNFGHGFGDELLKVFGRHLQDLMSEDITISRFGGDEFVILFTELPSQLETANFQCERMAEILLESLAGGIDVKQQHVYVSVSLGLTVSDCENDDEHSLLMQADAAMYQAKAMGKNTFRFYTQSIGEAMNERFSLEAALRKELKKAAEDSRFFMVYQPQFDADKQIVGAEALVRWNSQEFGFVSPFRFISVAEESGLIDELGMLVVENVLDDIKRMDRLFEKSSLQHISINLSIKQLTNPNLAKRLLEIFKEKEVEPERVRFEFTESAFLDNALDPKKLFSEMSAMGFTFSLDDFGTGFSSLSYLKELPISELKIDKSFVDGIPHDESDTKICSATIDMAQNLGLEVVAEGVEEQAQFDWLIEQDCNLLQGFLLGKPMPYDEFIKLFQV